MQHNFRSIHELQIQFDDASQSLDQGVQGFWLKHKHTVKIQDLADVEALSDLLQYIVNFPLMEQGW